MPDMNGLEVIGKIREMFYGKKDELGIILLSSSSVNEAVAKSSEVLGVNHRLVKPVKMQDIYRVLSQLYQQTSLVIDPEPVLEPAISTTQDPTILIAEDNAINMLLTKTMVKRLIPNAKILKAENGVEAIGLCQQSWPDLILMDMQMPEMNGWKPPGGSGLWNRRASMCRSLR